MNMAPLKIDTIKYIAGFKNNHPGTMRARGVLKALEKAQFKCEKCESTKGLTTNHLEEEAYGWYPDTLQILCNVCHGKINRGVEVSQILKENTELKQKIQELEGKLKTKKTRGNKK